MSEAAIQRDILAALALLGFEAFRLNAGTAAGGKVRLAPVGTPDIQCVLPPRGRSCWIEVKTSTGQLRPAQEKWRDKFAPMGIRYTVARSVREAVEAVTGWADEESAITGQLERLEGLES